MATQSMLSLTCVRRHHIATSVEAFLIYSACAFSSLVLMRTTRATA